MSKCQSGKVIYTDELEAKIALSGVSSTGANVDNATYYLCNRCKGWHITTKNKIATQNTPGSRQRRFERRQKVRKVA